MIKAKYRCMGAIRYKYFNSKKEMYDFFEEYKCCKYIDHENEGDDRI